MRDFLDQRVRDGVICRMIDKWLKVGILEAGRVSLSDSGVPQGSGDTPRTQRKTFVKACRKSDAPRVARGVDLAARRRALQYARGASVV
jgi:hypothetical protein